MPRVTISLTHNYYSNMLVYIMSCTIIIKILLSPCPYTLLESHDLRVGATDICVFCGF